MRVDYEKEHGKEEATFISYFYHIGCRQEIKIDTIETKTQRSFGLFYILYSKVNTYDALEIL